MDSATIGTAPVGSDPLRQRPTLEDVARKAGVSRSLASLALRGSTRVAQSTSTTIWAAANELGYKPNLAARNLASHRTATLGVLLNDLHNPFFAEVFDGLTEAAAATDHQVLLTTSRNRRAGERAAVESMIEHRVDGVVLVGPLLPSAELTVIARQVPMAIVGRVLRSDAVDCVTNDDAAGARLVVDHLAALGHQHAVHIDGGNGAGAGVRRAGFLDAADARGVRAEVITGDFTERAGIAGARTVLKRKRPPTALFCANDLVAVAAMDTLRQAGISIPEDMSIAGYDNTSLARLTQIHLTSVAQPTYDMGRVAVETLTERLAGRTEQRIESVTPSLVVRTSTGPAAS
jgi:DNA-binding LacI/PurR family transcriptional regulator